MILMLLEIVGEDARTKEKEKKKKKKKEKRKKKKIKKREREGKKSTLVRLLDIPLSPLRSRQNPHELYRILASLFPILLFPTLWKFSHAQG